MTITKSKMVLEAELAHALKQRGELEEASQKQDEIIWEVEAENQKLWLQVELFSDKLLRWRIASIVGWGMVLLMGLSI